MTLNVKFYNFNRLSQTISQSQTVTPSVFSGQSSLNFTFDTNDLLNRFQTGGRLYFETSKRIFFFVLFCFEEKNSNNQNKKYK